MKHVVPTFRILQIGDATHIVMRGEFDHQAGKDLNATLQRLLNESPSTVTVDMAEVDFIDSGGLEMLLRLHHRIVDAGGGLLSVTRASAATWRTFEACGLVPMFRFEGARGVA